MFNNTSTEFRLLCKAAFFCDNKKTSLTKAFITVNNL